MSTYAALCGVFVSSDFTASATVAAAVPHVLQSNRTNILMPKESPMLSVEIIQAMVTYHYALFRRVWDTSIMTLTDEQFITEIPYSHGSVRNHMVHLAAVDRGWMLGMQEDPNARANRPQPADFPTRASAHALWENSAQQFSDYVATLDEDALRYHPQDLPLTRWQTILHVVNHGTDHRAQVLRALHDLGAPTFEQDMFFYFTGR